ncbi:MAG: dTDP-4-dehydrorhamnose 3,5-epimerase family protein [Patescibacteria group bacterium]|nr:dTDP-4-dehydrorhamnose 3,5-epimerase family protein [Patescibacteria group bacterium]
MIAGVIIKKLNKYEDERGWLTEIYRHDEIDFIPAMAYVSVTKPSIKRGPHEHVYQTDCFIFIGPGVFELYLWDRRENSKTKGKSLKIKAGDGNPTLVIIPPGVVHGYKAISDCDAQCINLIDKLYKGIKKDDEIDEIRWEDKKDSPYKID